MSTLATKRPYTSVLRWSCSFVISVIILSQSTPQIRAQPVESAISNSLYTSAYQHYTQARFTSSRDSLEKLTQVADLGVLLKQRTFKLLGRVYVILKDYESARDAIWVWIETDPLRAEIDPNIELPEFVRLYYEVRKKFNELNYCPDQIEEPHPCQYAERTDPGIQTVAIGIFQNNSLGKSRSDYAPLSDGLSDIMIEHLAMTNTLAVVEREELEWLLGELKLPESGILNNEQAARIGNIKGAHAVMVGYFIEIDGQLRIGARMVHVESSEVVLANSKEGKTLDFFKTTEDLAKSMAELFEARIDSEASERDSIFTRNLDAVLLTSQGNAFFNDARNNQGNYDIEKLRDARDLFQKALEFDPKYKRARQRLEILELLIQAQ